MGEQVRISGDALLLPGGVTVRFMRTLRLPETGTHPLPPGLGTFPLRRVSDHAGTVPGEWLERGGVMLPVYQREAMWLSFSAAAPAALQVGVGKVCAVSGRPWSDRLSQDPQNYLVLPRQPWLDGINSGSGTIRQFVAVPLGLGATVEGQVTGEEVWGGVQLQVSELGEEQLAVWQAEQRRRESIRHAASGGYGGAPGAMPMAAPAAAAPPAPGSAARPARSAGRSPVSMGLGAGGRMRQEVYRDDRKPSDWREKPSGRVFVHLTTVPEWRRITGEPAPPSPVDRAAYTAAGLPWFDYYDADAEDLAAPDALNRVKPVGDWLGADESAWVAPHPDQVKHLKDKGQVADGEW
ncbi:hypothetical protein PV703_18640 [Streptomyces sp. ME01-24h]|nr:hypothetical protein [Streptomyces sp. ME19-03-3]MDX3355288.1 hypothetical protein [Streptomyces sp. ME01-24h]